MSAEHGDEDGVRVEVEGGGGAARGKPGDPCAVVIFGGAGDLARRKLIPALYHLGRAGNLPAGFAIAGVGRTERSSDDYRALMRESLGEFSRTKPIDEAEWDRLAGGLEYLTGDIEDLGTYARLADWLAKADRERGTAGNRLYYLATPSSQFSAILSRLHAAGLLTREDDPQARPWARVVVEKPFGHDLPSARALNQQLAEHLGEPQVFRIDHYLGKETVQNILVFRFGNSIFEPLWNRKYISHVEVTAAEAIGVEGRGDFYDQTGVVRDMLQNHLLQVLTLCAMEPPVSFEAEEVRDEKAQVLRSLRPIWAGSDEVVLGQYRGYREIDRVAPGSRTPTYVALKLWIDNWRWQGVPFYLRTGKSLQARMTEIAVHFQAIPLCLFGRDDSCARVEPNVLTLRIQPDEGIALRFACKDPGEAMMPRSVTMDFSYARAFELPVGEAYERLLADCTHGDATRFARRDAVELSWGFVAPLLEPPAEEDLHIYEPGSPGPAAADRLLRHDGHAWRPLG